MGEVQLWQADGLGKDKETLEKVLRIFRSDGVQGIESQQALNGYIERLSNDSLQNMYEIDEEATIQILVDCFGAVAAFHKFALIVEYIDINKKELERAGWISPAAYTEAVGKYEERAKKLEEQKDRILSDYTRAAQIAEDAEEKIFSLQDELAHCKADLYDFYAKAGKLPDYERR